MVSTGRSTCSY